MITFCDKNDRQWQLDIDVAAMRRAKKAGVDLSMPVQTLDKYMFDDCYLCDALWAVVCPQASKQAITQEHFELALNGRTLADARDRLFDALGEYFDPKKSNLLRTAVEATKAEMDQASTSLGCGEPRENSDET